MDSLLEEFNKRGIFCSKGFNESNIKFYRFDDSIFEISVSEISDKSDKEALDLIDKKILEYKYGRPTLLANIMSRRQDLERAMREYCIEKNSKKTWHNDTKFVDFENSLISLIQETLIKIVFE